MINLKEIDFTEDEINNFYLLVGSNVKRIREDKNITQMQLAHAIGHNSVGHVSKAEINKYNKRFSLEQLYKISKVLNVPISSFFEPIQNSI
jgi:transcriptional regulator with XRE-family HTH domain